MPYHKQKEEYIVRQKEENEKETERKKKKDKNQETHE